MVRVLQVYGCFIGGSWLLYGCFMQGGYEECDRIFVVKDFATICLVGLVFTSQFEWGLSAVEEVSPI